jgi:hypothetical protein
VRTDVEEGAKGVARPLLENCKDVTGMKTADCSGDRSGSKRHGLISTRQEKERIVVDDQDRS